MAKGRSPNYPSLTLMETMERLRPVYEGIHTYPSPKEVIAENMGYNSLSGRALTLIGTMRRYGLLESEGGGLLKVSDLAVSILELPDKSPELQRAYSQAALTPVLFSELHSEFPDKLPNDAMLRHHLIKKGFMPRAADEIIRVYKGNEALVEEQAGEYNPPMPIPESTLPLPPSQKAHIARTFASKTESDLYALGVSLPPLDASKQLRFNISRGSEAHVIFRGPVTQEAIEKLAKLLELQKDTFPTEAELQPVEKQEGGE